MLSRSILRQARSFSSSAARSHFAKFSAIGFVANLQSKEKKDGGAFVTYSLGVEKYSPNSAEEKEVDFFNVSVFDDAQVNYFQQYVKPGSRLYVEGSIKNRSYVDSEDKKRVQTQFLQKTFEKISIPRPREEAQETSEEA